jgi:Na+/Pi-cotransporter
MSTIVSILGGVGLFLLGMTVMTDGLKTLAGSALRTVLGKAASTPLRGSFWGAVLTLLVQSSSATTMTTIGLVSAGLLTFEQGLGLVFGANVGTTGTGWLVALVGVRVSLTAAALPMIFAGAMIKQALCSSVEAMLQAVAGGSAGSGKGVSVPEAADALRQAQVFMSEVSGPPKSEDEQRRLMSTVHALDNASRLAETASPEIDLGAVSSGPGDVRAAELCADVMRRAASIAGEIAALPGDARSKPPHAAPEAPGTDAAPNAPGASTQESLDLLERSAKELGELRRTHRSATLSAVASGALTAGEAIARVERVRNLDALAHHAWRSAAHLVGRGTSHIETQRGAS